MNLKNLLDDGALPVIDVWFSRLSDFLDVFRDFLTGRRCQLAVPHVFWILGFISAIGLKHKIDMKKIRQWKVRLQ